METDEPPCMESRKLPPGTRVRVPKDTPIVYDTGPLSALPTTTKRTQTVTVHWMTHNPDTIYWVGSGGYWKGAILTDEMAAVTLDNADTADPVER